MGNIDRADDRTFKVNFSSVGAVKLRDTVKEKLKEFMGDCTDDTLVEYVIVLLRNGRRKDEARNELDVFLADDSDSFVSWLWDHLASSLDLYVQTEEPEVAKEIKAKPLMEKQYEGSNVQSADNQEGEKPPNILSRRHNREWRGIVRDAAEPPALLSSEVEVVPALLSSEVEVVPALLSSEVEVVNVEKPHGHRVGRTKRSDSPRRQKKRTRSEERNSQKKRELLSQSIDAPRRLLQFAVREAVATAVPDPATGSSLKRLRSVVSTSASDPSVDRASRIHSVARMPNAMATVIKAVAEAAEDVRRAKVPGSVFDRLGRGLDVVEPELIEAEAVRIDERYDVDFEHFQEELQPRYVERQQLSDDDMMMVMEREVELVSEYPSEYEQYEEVHIAALDVVPQIDPIAEDAFTVQHSVVNNSDDSSRLGWNKDQDELPVAANNAVDVHGNVSAWKPPPQYRARREITEPRGQMPLRRITLPRAKSDLQDMKENGGPGSIANGNANAAIQKLQSTSGLINQSTEDADRRTIFVNNVHTAATKDSLSQHFSKFGEVVKVIIHTDATTGLPTGSATIEFSQNATADSALSLDGTSFMSRVLKVVKRSSGIQKPPAAAAGMSWSRGVGNPATQPYGQYHHPRGASSFSPFARGGGFRGRGSVMRGVGARSLQWKREGQAAPAANNTSTLPVAAGRRFTYIRTEPKPNNANTN